MQSDKIKQLDCRCIYIQLTKYIISALIYLFFVVVTNVKQLLA